VVVSYSTLHYVAFLYQQNYLRTWRIAEIQNGVFAFDYGDYPVWPRDYQRAPSELAGFHCRVGDRDVAPFASGKWMQRAGFRLPRIFKPGEWRSGTEFRMDVPLWLPFLLFATPAAIWWVGDWRRLTPGFCRECGYNLTGNTSGICPECGTAIRNPGANSK